jgi:hypothetical protein
VRTVPQAEPNAILRMTVMARSRTRIVWSNPGNPPDAVARALGMEPRHFSRALHKIKAASDLSGSDRVVIYSDGWVTDDEGEPLGNLHDED